MFSRTKRKNQKPVSQARQDRILERYPNIDELFSKEPGVSPWYQRDHKQIFMTPKGRLTWSRPNEELLLMNQEGDVVGIVRSGTIVKQIDHRRLLVSYETRYLNPSREDSEKKNALEISLVRIDDIHPIKDFKAVASRIKEQCRQMAFGGAVDATCAVPLKVAEGLHFYEFPEALKSLDEVLHLSDYLPSKRTPEQFDAIALFVMRPKKNEYEVFPQDWYNFAGVDSMYMFPDKAVRDPLSGRVFLHGIRLRDVVLDDTYRNGKMR